MRVGVEVRERSYGRAVAHIDSARETGKSAVGEHDAGLVLEHAEESRRHSYREAALHLATLQPLPRDATCIERTRRTLTEVAYDLEQTVELEQLLARFRFELAPARERLLRKPHPVWLRIGEAEDARAAVARTARVVSLELLMDHDLASRARERARSRKAHHSGPDYGDPRHGGAILAPQKLVSA